ncbi:MAG: hypothetical protein ACLR23_04035 [Clostridia bacterium]
MSWRKPWHISSDVKTISDNSPSKIAEMVIQGNTMGVTKMTKRIHEYDGDNKKIVALAQKHVAMEEDNIEEDEEIFVMVRSKKEVVVNMAPD